MSSKVIKVLGIVATLAGAGLTLLNGYIDDKKMDEKINNALDEREKKNDKEA